MVKKNHPRLYLPACLVILAVVLAGCGGNWIASIDRICIHVEQSYSGSAHTEPIAQDLQELLERMGIQATIGEDNDCKADLSVKLQFTPIAERVIGADTDCYIEAEAAGEVVLEAGNQRSSKPLHHAKRDSGIYGITNCPSQPAQAPFTHTWATELMPVLREWWGTPAVLSALHSSNYYLRSAATDQIGRMGEQASALVPVFVEM